MQITIGSQVETIDDSIKGTVVKLEGDKVVIITSEGFEFEYFKRELIVLEDSLVLKKEIFKAHSLKEVLSEKQIDKKKKSIRIKPKERQQPAMEVDLHIEKLVDNTKGMSNFDILNYQINTAKRRLEFAISKKIQKIVFIHGVGEGVLQSELKTLFERFDSIKYYDADFKKYGYGAIEVYVFQNQ